MVVTSLTTATYKAGILLSKADERAKARARMIDGRYPELAVKVRHLLGWYEEDNRPFLTSRMAQRKTGINHATITTMARGDRPAYQTILKLVQGLGGNANDLLQSAGFDTIAPSEPDPLSRIGPDVDFSAVADIRLSPFLVSAGDGFVPPEPGMEHETFRSVLPGEIRAIRVTGDCMAPLYQDGDVVFVREQGNAENGNKVIAMVDEDKLFCKVYRTNGEAYLEPKTGEGKVPASRFRIIGVIVGVFRKED